MHQISFLSQYGRCYCSLYRPTSVTYSDIFKTQGVGSQSNHQCDSLVYITAIGNLIIVFLRYIIYMYTLVNVCTDMNEVISVLELLDPNENHLN